MKNGRVVDPRRKIDSVADVFIRDGKIRAIGGATRSDIPVFDATGLIVAPGFFDIHVHLREPGTEEAETIASGGTGRCCRRFHCGCGDAEHEASKRQSFDHALHRFRSAPVFARASFSDRRHHERTKRRNAGRDRRNVRSRHRRAFPMMASQ